MPLTAARYAGCIHLGISTLLRADFDFRLIRIAIKIASANAEAPSYNEVLATSISQSRHHAWIFIDDLQGTLQRLGLIGRVRSAEIPARE